MCSVDVWFNENALCMAAAKQTPPVTSRRRSTLPIIHSVPPLEECNERMYDWRMYTAAADNTGVKGIISLAAIARPLYLLGVSVKSRCCVEIWLPLPMIPHYTSWTIPLRDYYSYHTGIPKVLPRGHIMVQFMNIMLLLMSAVTYDSANKYFRISLERDKNKWGKWSLLLISWCAPDKVRCLIVSRPSEILKYC